MKVQANTSSERSYIIEGKDFLFTEIKGSCDHLM